MRTSRVTFALAGWLVGVAPVAALDTIAPPQAKAPVAGFGSARDALRSGVRDYNKGDKVGAVRALEFAATQGHALALWKLGRMYADGDGVPHDDLKAFEYFSKIADENADETPDSPNAAVVASAFVALGTYFLEGIASTYVKPNVARAQEMFQYAASYFGDPAAQYSLARLYLDGTGVEQDARQAARWFNLAAEKGHAQAQALLGQLLINGQGVPRQRARGLMWLTLARDGADPVKDAWIVKLHDQAFAAASESERQSALASLEQFLRKRR
ncbi:MAG TPA: tetratricopeptide repeat protein [Beijerinckiaceae bacterium]|jgi:TPR repeat protein